MIIPQDSGISYIGSAIYVITMVHNKVLGYSSHDFTAEELQAMGKTDMVSEISLDVLTNTTLAFVKLSALFFYRRIFCSAGGRLTAFNAATWATIVVVVLWLLVFQFLAGFQCGTHFSALWDGSYLQYCTISFPFLYGLVISDFLLDVWILALPIPSILRLHTTPQRKLSIIGIFLLALVGLGASIARMVQYIKIELGGPDYLLHTDYQRLITQSFFFTMFEAGMALIAVNLPSLRVFSVSLKPAELINSMRSLLDSSFPWSGHSGSDIVAQNSVETPAAGTIGILKTVSFSTIRPSGSSNGMSQDLPLTSIGFIGDTDTQRQNVVEG
ncbi:hypothetical protein F4779DRAFT_596223 [Xylariaceae sp. FL0662B]|nr:hypothetical protein F4779DRAFT_596223 [Xylariaceae sp. FL0662B]